MRKLRKKMIELRGNLYEKHLVYEPSKSLIAFCAMIILALTILII